MYRKKKADSPNPALDKPVLRFQQNVDMDKLLTFLEEDPELESFTRALQDPGLAHVSFVTLCRKFYVPLSKLQQIYTDGMRHLGLLRMSTALPEIMEHVAEDAKSKMVLCSRCDGEGTVKTGGPAEEGGARICPACDGAKKVRVLGDKHARDLVFESMKLTNQNGPMVAIQQNFQGGDDSMEALFKTSQMITVGKKEEITE